MSPKTSAVLLSMFALIIGFVLVSAINLSRGSNRALSAKVTETPVTVKERDAKQQPLSEHRVYLPYWRAEDGFYTKIYIRNTNVRTSMVASVSLVGTNGTLKLSDITIEGAHTFSFDVQEAFSQNSNPQSGQGSAYIDFLAESSGAINAFAQIVNESKSFALSFPFQRSTAEAEKKLEGIAWFYDSATDVFVSMYNTSERMVIVTPNVFVGRHPMKLAHVKLKAFEAATIRIPRIEPKSDEYPVAVGVTLKHSGAPGAIVAQGWATNTSRGFSSGFSFTSTASCDCKPGEKRQIYGTGIPIGLSTMMNGAVFNPLLILRNTSETNLHIQPIFSFMAGNVPEKVVLPTITIAPQETNVTNLRQYQLEGLIPETINNGGSELQFESKTGGLIAELTSVDLTGFYSAQVPLVCGGKRALHMSYWRTDGDWDSICSWKTSQNTTLMPK